MFKIHPSYYLTQAFKAKDYNSFLQAYIAYVKTTQIQSLFMVDHLVNQTQKFYQNLFGVKA